MNIVAGLDTPTAGSVRVAGYDLATMSQRQQLAYSRRVVGFIFPQTSRNLLPYLTGQAKQGSRSVAVRYRVYRERRVRPDCRWADGASLRLTG